MLNDESDDNETFLYKLERESEVQKLIAHLKRSKKTYVRRRAATMLGNISEIPDSNERRQAAKALVSAVKTDEDDSVRAAAIDALYQRGEEAFDYLVAELAEMELSEATERTVTGLLTEWLSADRLEFRMVAATALGERGATAAVPDLVRALTDPAPRVRTRAAQACGRLSDLRAVSPLSERLSDDRQQVREAAANALGAIGTDRALAELVPITQADEETLRLTAVDELGQFGSVKPVVVLVDALDDNSSTVQQAAMLSLLELLTTASSEELELIRGTVVDELARTDVQATVPALLDIATDGTRRRYRQTAIWLLTRITGDRYRSEVIDCLLSALNDVDEETAKLAEAVLPELRCPELEKRLRVYLSRERGSEDAQDRVQTVLDEICDGSSGELVTTGVDYTYVDSPADYTNQYSSRD
ncbi:MULTISPECIES: HEAT repeat domain-containing protein [Haloarcula]|uniref:HEAT repeat domain-containing protein n=3 Tax=Haloarcula TaxID=2237 RepID=A0ACC6VMK1_9EURY|nr:MULTISPECIES: HEAT repeat domain-containing protein [Haloarcula]EMA31526.1 phycocyanin alpha phycocyanobilin lyase-like protein [Haloarcula japonica DSM 6131]GGK85327.1 phycocyanobilin lyase [Haloarcula sebkhae]